METLFIRKNYFANNFISDFERNLKSIGVTIMFIYLYFISLETNCFGRRHRVGFLK